MGNQIDCCSGQNRDSLALGKLGEAKIYKQGYLYKQPGSMIKKGKSIDEIGDSWLDGWRKRYFVFDRVSIAYWDDESAFKKRVAPKYTLHVTDDKFNIREVSATTSDKDKDQGKEKDDKKSKKKHKEKEKEDEDAEDKHKKKDKKKSKSHADDDQEDEEKVKDKGLKGGGDSDDEEEDDDDDDDDDDDEEEEEDNEEEQHNEEEKKKQDEDHSDAQAAAGNHEDPLSQSAAYGHEYDPTSQQYMQGSGDQPMMVDEFGNPIDVSSYGAYANYAAAGDESAEQNQALLAQPVEAAAMPPPAPAEPVEPELTAEQKRALMFEIVSSERTMLVRATSETEKKQWFEALQAFIKDMRELKEKIEAAKKAAEEKAVGDTKSPEADKAAKDAADKRGRRASKEERRGSTGRRGSRSHHHDKEKEKEKEKENADKSQEDKQGDDASKSNSHHHHHHHQNRRPSTSMTDLSDLKEPVELTEERHLALSREDQHLVIRVLTIDRDFKAMSDRQLVKRGKEVYRTLKDLRPKLQKLASEHPGNVKDVVVIFNELKQEMPRKVNEAIDRHNSRVRASSALSLE